MITKKINCWLYWLLFWTLVCCICPIEGIANEDDSLDQLSIEELMNSKVVTATRSEQQLTDTAAAAYVITQDDIRRSGATNVPEALRMVPGLHVARISSTKWAISARGFNGVVADKLLVLMDGRSLYSPINKGVFWDIQDRVLDDIERIEVIRGPGASVWGANAANGVINIITKHAVDTKEGNLTLFSGDKHGAGLRKGWQFADQGYARVYGKFLRDDTFANILGNDAKEEWTSGRGGFRLDWANSDGKHALMAQGDLYYGVYDENVAKEEVDPTNALLLNRVVNKGGNILLRWNYNQSLASRMSAQLFYDSFQSQESSHNPAALNNDIVDFDFQHVLALNEQHELTWGLNYRLSLVQLKPFNDPQNSSNILLKYLPKIFENNRLGVYFQDKWRWSDAIEITFGSKFEHHNNNDFEYEPSLRILWKPANQHRLWAGISRAVRLPAVTDLNAFEPNKNDPFPTERILKFRQYQNLASDEVISYELGYRYWSSDSFSVDLAAYYNQNTNNLRANPEFSRWFPDQNIKKSTTLGVEAAIIWRPFDWVRFQLSSSFTDRDINSLRKTADSFEFISQDPRFMAAFRSSFDIAPAIELDFWLRYADSVNGVVASQTVPSFVALDARLAWKPLKNVELAFIANNLNDSQHPEFYDGFTPNPLQVERMFWLQGSLKY